MIVSLDHVFKYYGADCILRDVCAAINEKDRIGLVGANGEGKTTLLNCLLYTSPSDAPNFRDKQRGRVTACGRGWF